MAAVNQPGSRAGLITALVIFVILFFIAAISAVVKSTDEKKSVQQLDTLKKQYDMVARSSEIATAKDEIAELLKDPAYRGMTFYEIAKIQREKLAEKITGQGSTSTSDAVDAGAKVIDSVNKQLTAIGVTVPANSLTSAIQVLANAVAERHDQAQRAKAAADAANQSHQAAMKAKDAEVEAHKAAVTAAEAKAAKAAQGEETFRKEKDGQVSALEKSVADEIAAKRAAAEALQSQLQAAQQEIEKRDKQIQRQTDIIANWKPRNLATSHLRRPDGRIIQVNKNSIVYISLGQGQQVTKGMTFEIYDRVEGIPAAGANTDDALPVGKGSLEVVNVGPGSSECRIIRTEPGTQVVEGDILANLIYDPNVKWKFKVFGEFDINQDGQATTAEAEIVKRLILEWGGQLTDKIDMDTDFVVMGREPVMPSTTKQQRDESPLLQFEWTKAEAALKAYDDVKSLGVGLHIPTLNQNRFLYMVGFYDQGKK